MPYCPENFEVETSQRKRVLETQVLIRWGYYTVINRREISCGDVENIVPSTILWAK